MISSPEVTSTQEIPITYEENRPFSLAEASQQVLNEGIYVHQFTDVQARLNKRLLSFTSFMDTAKPGIDSDIFQREGNGSELNYEKALFWESLTGDKQFRIIHDFANSFSPGNYMSRHTDNTGEANLDKEDEAVEISLTYLYVTSGEKDILFYKDEVDKEGRRLRQQPGMLIIFPMVDIVFTKDGEEVVIPTLSHEVPKQDASCETYTWELSPSE